MFIATKVLGMQRTDEGKALAYFQLRNYLVVPTITTTYLLELLFNYELHLLGTNLYI